MSACVLKAKLDEDDLIKLSNLREVLEDANRKSGDDSWVGLSQTLRVLIRMTKQEDFEKWVSRP